MTVSNTRLNKPSAFQDGLDFIAYARHEREIMRLKSSVRKPRCHESHGSESASRRQGRHYEVSPAGSRVQSCEPTNRNVIYYTSA